VETEETCGLREDSLPPGQRRQEFSASPRLKQEDSLLLGQKPFRIALSCVDQLVPVLLDVLRRTALERYVVRCVEGVNHIDRVPRADLGTMLAADAPIQVVVTPGLQRRVFLALDLVDTIDRANFKARLAARATICVDHGQDLRYDLAWFSGQGG